MHKIVVIFSILLICRGISLPAQNAPVTHAPFIDNAIPGNITADITVEDFTAIGCISLNLLYNPFVLTYQGAVPNAAFNAAAFSVSSVPVSAGVSKIIISYPMPATPVTLADGSVLVSLQFGFTTDNELNHSALTWFDDGTSCQYTDAANIPLADSPAEDYYLAGLVASQVAPVTFLPVLNFYTGGPFELPVTVNDFQDIGSISLTFSYDPAVITYSGTFTSGITGLSVDDLPASGGLNHITIGWFGSPLTLAQGSALAVLDFTYVSGATSLLWVDNGSSCEYADAAYLSLWDSPTRDYYQDAQVSPTPAPRIKADTVQAVSGCMAVVPLRIWDFSNINSMTLTLGYDDAVLAFQCATPHPDLAAGLTVDATNAGQLLIEWLSTEEKTLTDAVTLLYLTFTYTGGNSVLAWDNTGPACEYTTGALYYPLLDEPTGTYYRNGLVKAAPGPAVWSGASSSDWNDAANWVGNFVPDSFFDVFIETGNAPPHWPVYNGDLTLGSQCRDITLSGASILTVTGDLTLSPGRLLEVDGNGHVNIGGDWINEGLFLPGTGTVEFYGTASGSIPQDVYPGQSLCNYTQSTFTQGMTALAGATPGPSGDDAHLDVPLGFSFHYLDVAYTQIRINTNGWASLNLSGDDLNSGENSLLFYFNGPTTVLAPWWDDLEADVSSAITYLTEGTAPNRVFTAEWKQVLAHADGATARLDFQLKLYETTHVIEFCYGNVTAGTYSGTEGATIGLNDGGGGGGGCFLEGSTGSSCNILTCYSSDANWPASNYRFSPPGGTDHEVFWKMAVTKENSATLDIMRNTHVTGLE